MANLAELLRQGADKLVNLPTEAQRFVTNPQAFIQLLTGKNALPRETGFAAGATGLPAQQGTVLDPNYQAYMQGYEQGEPVSYAAMATPAVMPVAKALAPKAGQMAENYMVNQGFMPSLIAYHGTPHTIKGKFDISKVGTGEGAQAYGHGMYFAENPEVAKSYANLGTGNIAYRGHTEDVLNKLQKFGIDRETADLVSTFAYEGGYKGGTSKDLSNFLKSYADTPEEIKLYKDLSSKPEVVEAINSYVSPKQANLYKVDIPDADIPMMLEWGKPLAQQTPEVQTAIKKLGDRFRPLDDMEAKNVTGERLYRRIENSFGKYYGNQANPDASALLNSVGIKGIRYLDEGSRGTSKGTSNFVVFDPAQVKILEQNSKPMTRKEIIEQELKKVVE
jgi:hypothetical protein